MSSEISHYVRLLAPDGLQVNLWPSERGYQANVKEQGAPGWTISHDEDPLAALVKALRQRAARNPDRVVAAPQEPEQIDIEDVIATRPSSCDCSHGVPMHLHCGVCEAGEENGLAELGL